MQPNHCHCLYNYLSHAEENLEDVLYDYGLMSRTSTLAASDVRGLHIATVKLSARIDLAFHASLENPEITLPLRI